MPWISSRPARALVRPVGFIRPCQPYLAEKPPSGPDWQHEIKWDGYRIIARKEGERVRPWTRPGTDYTASLDRIRAAVAAQPLWTGKQSPSMLRAVRTSMRCAREEGQANAVLVAYDVLELDGGDVYE
jgi:bifunctional non-homologous end joining protein LigD